MITATLTTIALITALIGLINILSIIFLSEILPVGSHLRLVNWFISNLCAWTLFTISSIVHSHDPVLMWIYIFVTIVLICMGTVICIRIAKKDGLVGA